jgi:hypothetical protein
LNILKHQTMRIVGSTRILHLLINRTSPSFLMIDIDLKDFASKDKLDRAHDSSVLNRSLIILLNYPVVLLNDSF